MMDALDRKIVAALERDARTSFAVLADEVGLSKTPCWKRVKALEDAGIIRGYSTRIDPAKLGFGIEAFIQVSIDFELSEAFEAAVQAHPLIRRCHATTGEADYLLQIVTVDM
ncbi:MAG: Lrp/AsnC family transcriptional regulator, partial [Mesorhizobium sp.]